MLTQLFAEASLPVRHHRTGAPGVQQLNCAHTGPGLYQPKDSPSAAQIGFNAPRSCTDVVCIVLFAVVWVGMVAPAPW